MSKQDKKNNSNSKSEKSSASKRGTANKRKGNQYERDVRLDLMSIGFNKCKSSRLASKLYDDCGVDHWGTMLPDGTILLTQCKAGYARNFPKAPVEFKNQRDKIERYFPDNSPERNPDNIQALFHKVDGYFDYNHNVTLTYKNFLKIMKVYVKSIRVLQKSSALTEQDKSSNS